MLAGGLPHVSARARHTTAGGGSRGRRSASGIPGPNVPDLCHPCRTPGPHIMPGVPSSAGLGGRSQAPRWNGPTTERLHGLQGGCPPESMPVATAYVLDAAGGVERRSPTCTSAKPTSACSSSQETMSSGRFSTVGLCIVSRKTAIPCCIPWMAHAVNSRG